VARRLRHRMKKTEINLLTSGVSIWAGSHWFCFSIPKLSCHGLALGLTQHLTEISSKNLPGGKARPASMSDITGIYERTVQKMWDPRRLTNL
jgi:hypothetical protein